MRVATVQNGKDKLDCGNYGDEEGTSQRIVAEVCLSSGGFINGGRWHTILND